jgi:lysylphosphatidylglycerol synthetase-like protein (DUF2156 family)
MKKTLVAGILGGVIAFIWSAIAHVNPLTGMLGLSMMNTQAEEAVATALKSNVQRQGLYFFPGCDMKHMTKEQEAAWTAKHKAGPVGLLLYDPAGRDPMDMTQQLLVEFLATALCGCIAASILSATVGSIRCRATMVAMMGLFTWLAISISQWTWYRFPFSFIALDAIDQVIGWLLAGFLMAKMIKPAQPQVIAKPTN